MSTMSVPRYRSICRYAGYWLASAMPNSIPLDEIESITAGSAVYVICEPLERVQYVGSVCRPNQTRGVATRLREHLREGYKRLSWKTVWIVPLKPETPIEVVRGVEACVGTDLAPLGKNRLPAL